MATVAKIEKDITRTKERIAELQKKLRNLEAQKIETENLEIVNLVKAVRDWTTPHSLYSSKPMQRATLNCPTKYKAELVPEQEPDEETEDGADEE